MNVRDRFSPQPLNEEVPLMLERELNLFAMVISLAHKMVSELDEAQLTEQPVPNANHPAWILGHLAVVSDLGTKLLGGTPLLPEDWQARYGPGSRPLPDRSAYPSKGELLSAFDRASEAFVEVARKAGERRLGQPNPLPFFKEELPTVGDLAAHLMTTHPMLHLGQLSMWRRIHGLPGVLGF
jgi:hypothetical protein